MAFLVKPIGFLLIILLGYLLMRFGFFKEGHQHVISKIVLNITLPAAAVQAFGSAEKNNSLLLLVLFGFLCGLIPLLAAYFISFRCEKARRVFFMLNSGGYNVGCFALPVVQSFFGAAGGVLVCIFDIGNAVIMTGGVYAITASLLHTDGARTTVRGVLKKFFGSVAFDVYMIMLVLMVLNIPIPQAVLTVTEPLGSANAFLAMLMLGMMFKPQHDRQYVSDTARLLILRLAFSALFSVLLYRFAPFGPEVRRVLAVVVFAPIGSLSVIFTGKCKGDESLASFANSLSVLLSLVLMSALCAWMLA